MIHTAGTVVDAFFLKGGAGNVFCTLVRPQGSAACRSAVLFVPPFAEEMNKARKQVMLAARSVAESGHCVLAVDLFGTGDSEGHFAEARWETWLEDLRAAQRWLADRGLRLGAVWALRSGALLAAELSAGGMPPAPLLLWQPVTHGQRYMDQFLRMRVAAAMVGAAPNVGVKDLRRELDSGSSLEVGGYEVHPELVRQIDSQDLSRSAPPPGSRVTWVEIVAAADTGISVPAQRVIAAWKASGIDVEAVTVTGVPFWSTVEIAVVPELGERTAELFGSP